LLAAAFGWRTAFVVLGLAGLPIAVLIALTLPEPRAQAREEEPAAEPVGPLLRRRSFQLLLAGFAFGAFAMTGLLQWLPSHFSRYYGLPIATVGVQFGLSYGLGAISGMLAGGAVATRLMQADSRWALRLASLSYLLAFPPMLGMLLAGEAVVALAFIFLATAAASVAFGPAFAMIQIIAPPRLRALATAVAMFVSNLLGAGLGPLAIGLLSDWHGGDPAEALRWALLCILPVLLAPALLYALALKAYSREQAEAGRCDLSDGINRSI
jgi:predicted MFS family arabinose efflux permease